MDNEPVVTATVTYKPWTDGYAVGYKVTRHADGEVSYIYFNPSFDDESISHPDVFVYIGTEGDPQQDEAVHYYVPFKEA